MINFNSRQRSFSAQIKKLIGFRPGKLNLYELALIPPSSSQTPGEILLNNERLEYLGDAVLETIITDYLFKKYSDKDEGFLTKARSQLVNRVSLNKTGKILELASYIKPPVNNNRHAKNYLGNSLEAIIGAIYLDRGFRYARKFVCSKIIEPYSETELNSQIFSDFKSRLIEWGQKNKKDISFKTSAEDNKDNIVIFHTELYINKELTSRGNGKTKKESEQKASENAMLIVVKGEE